MLTEMHLIEPCFLSRQWGVPQTTNYILSILWVFDRRAVQSRWIEFCIFGVIGLIGLGLNEGIIWFFTEKVHFHYISKIIATVAIYCWNFFARKYTLFS